MRFVLLKKANCYMRNVSNGNMLEYHFMVERVGLKKIYGEQQKRFSRYSDALKYADEIAKKENCSVHNSTGINPTPTGFWKKNQKRKRKDLVVVSNNKQESIRKKTDKNRPKLKNYFSNDRPLMVRYKGNDRQATLLTSGRVIYKNEEYRSPNEVANIIMREINPQTKTKRNAWNFWYVKDMENNWVKLDTLE